MCIPYNNTKHNIQQIWVQQVKQRTSCICRFTCSPGIPVPGSPSKPRRPGNPISPWMRPTGFIFHWNDTQQHCVYSNQISFLAMFLLILGMKVWQKTFSMLMSVMRSVTICDLSQYQYIDHEHFAAPIHVYLSLSVLSNHISASSVTRVKEILLEAFRISSASTIGAWQEWSSFLNQFDFKLATPRRSTRRIVMWHFNGCDWTVKSIKLHLVIWKFSLRPLLL